MRKQKEQEQTNKLNQKKNNKKKPPVETVLHPLLSCIEV